MKRLKSTYLAIAGAPLDEVGGVPEGLTAEKMVEVVKVYFDASMEATRSVLEGLKAQVRCSNHAFRESFCMLFLLDALLVTYALEQKDMYVYP